MAEDNVIGIAMGLDVTNLKAGLSEANKQIALANSKFKAASSGMDDWTKSSEGLKAKLEQLASVQDMQKRKLAGLNAEYKKIVAKEGEASDSARKLQKQIYEQQAAIGKTEKEQRKYTSSLKQFSGESKKAEKATKDLGKSTKDLKGSLEGLNKGFSIVKGTIAGVLTQAISGYIKGVFAAVEQSREFRKELGMLEATAKTTGASFSGAKENLLEVASITEDTGAATEGMNNLLSAGFDGSKLDAITDELVGASIKWKDTLKFEGLADGLQETLATGSAVGPFAELLDRAGASTEAFDLGLANCTTEAEKQQFALDQLSKLGLSEVKKEYEETNGSLIDYNRAALDNQNAMAGIGEAMQPLQTIIMNLKTKGIELLTPAVEKFSEVAQKAFGGDLAGAGADVMTFFSDVATKFTEGISSLASKIPEMAPQIAEALGTFATDYLGRISELFPVILEALTALIQAIVAALPGLLEQIISSLTELLPTLLDAVMQMLNGLVDALPQLINTIVSALPGLIDAIVSFLTSALPQILDAAVQLFTGIVEALPSVINTLVSALPKLITSIVGFLGSAIPKIVDAGIKLLTAIVDNLPTIISSIVKALPQIISAIVNALLKALPQIIDAGLKLLTALIGALPQIISTIVAALPQIIGGIVNGLLSALPQIIMAGVQLFVALVQNLPAIISGVVSAIPKIISGMKEAFANSKDEMADAGLNLIKGLWEGITNAAGWLKDKLAGFVNDTTAHIKKFFGIKSPSRVMRDQVGVNISKGVGNGIAKGTKSVTKEMTKLGKATLKTAKQANGDYEKAGKSAIKSMTSGMNASAKESIQNVKNIFANQSAKMKGYSKDAQKEFKEAGKATISAYSTAIKDGTAKAVKQVSDTLTKIGDKAQDKYDDIADKQKDLRDNLNDTGDLWTLNSNGTVGLNNLKDETKQINAFGANLLKLKKKLPKGMMAEIAGLDAEEGKAVTDKILSLSAKQLKEYVKSYNDRTKASKNISSKYYADEVKSVKTQYNKQITDAYAELPKKIEAIGKSTMDGFSKGMKSGTKGMSKDIKKISNDIVKQFKKSLKIHSPSKVFAVLGEYSGLGYLEGFSDKVNGVKGGLAASLPLSEVGRAGVAREGARNVQNNFTQNIYAPKQPSRIELYRQSKNLLSLKGV